MAELGVASGVAGLLSLTFDVIQMTGKYIHAVSSSTRSVLDVLDVLSSLQVIFNRFQKQVSSVELDTIVGIRPPALSLTTITVCEERLKELKAVLERYLNAEGHLKKRHAVAWPFCSDQTKALLESLESYRDTFHAALSADIFDVSLSTHHKIVASQASDHLHAVLHWLSPYGTPVTERLEDEVDTTDHVSMNQAFRNWLATPGDILWCYGDSGCGKTILTSILHRNWTKIFASSTYNPLVYFYDYRNSSAQSADSVARSFFAQIIQQDGVVPPEIGSMYTDFKTRNQQPSKNLIKDLLARALRLKPGMVLLVDAFDECQYRADSLAMLRSMAAEGAHRELLPDDTLEVTPSDSAVSDLINMRLLEVEDDLGLNEAFKRKISSDIIAQCGGILLLVRLMLDNLVKATSRKEMREAIDKLPTTLPEMYGKILDQIKRSRHANLADRVIRWIVHAGRPLQIQELQHGLAVESGTSELDEDNLINSKTILSSCLGLIALDKFDFIRPIHTSVFEFLLNKGHQILKTVHKEFSLACLSYLSFETFAAGPCVDSDELEDRIRYNPFALYAAKFLGHHCQYVEDDFLEQVIKLLSDEGIRKSATQLFHHQKIKGEALRHEAFSILPKGQGAIQIACGLGLTGVTKRLIDLDHDISAPDLQGWRPLNTAASYGHKHIVNILLNSGADPNCQDKHGWTPLIWSVVKGHIEVAQELLTAGAAILTSDTNGWTAMHWAASIGEPTMVALLTLAWDDAMEHQKARSAKADNFLDPLLIAVDTSNIVALETMIDVHSKSFCPLPSEDGLYRLLTKSDKGTGRFEGGPGARPLVFPGNFVAKMLDSAIQSGHLSMVKLLLERVIPKNTYRELNGRSPLHTAIFCESSEIPCLLVSYGYELETVDSKGYSVLDLAARNGTVEVIKTLLNLPKTGVAVRGGQTSPLHQIWNNTRLLRHHGVKPFSDDSQSGPDPAYLTEEARQAQKRLLHTQFEIAELLLGLGADVNKPDNRGQTPIFHAISSGVEAITFLETRGAILNIAGSSGNTLLHYCMTQEELHEKDRYAYYNSFNLIGREQSHQLAQIAINHGVQINAQNSEGLTVLHYALKYGRLADVLFYLDHGADPNLMTKQNETFLCYLMTLDARWKRNLTDQDQLVIMRVLIEKCGPGIVNMACKKHSSSAEDRIQHYRDVISRLNENLEKNDQHCDTYGCNHSKIKELTAWMTFLIEHGNDGSPLALAINSGDADFVAELRKHSNLLLD